jgi:tetratricopeptide (TPR) repeat protein
MKHDLKLFLTAAIMCAAALCIPTRGNSQQATPTPVPNSPAKLANAHKIVGSLSLSQKAYADAIKAFSSCIRLDPAASDCHGLRGDAYYATGQHDLAIADFSQVLKVTPNDSRSLIGRGRAYFSKARAVQDSRFDKENYSLALVDLEAASKLEPSIQPLKQMVDELRKLIADGERLAVLKADLVERGKRIKDSGAAMLMLGRFDTAISAFSSCIRANEKDAECWALRASAIAQKLAQKPAPLPAIREADAAAMRRDALADANRALELDPKQEIALIARGRIYSLEKLNDKAIADFRAALKHNPASTDAKAELKKLGVAP